MSKISSQIAVWLIATLIIMMPASFLGAKASDLWSYSTSVGRVQMNFYTMGTIEEYEKFVIDHHGNFFSQDGNQLNAIGIFSKATVSHFINREMVSWFSGLYDQIRIEYIDGIIENILVVKRNAPQGFSKEPLQYLPYYDLTKLYLSRSETVREVSGGLWQYFSPAKFDDTDSHWAGQVINQLTKAGVLVVTEDSMMDQFFFFPDKNATRMESIVWLELGVKPQIETEQIAKEWAGDKTSSDYFFAQYGYQYEGVGNLSNYWDTVRRLTMFGPIDAALKTGVLLPDADGGLRLSSTDYINRAEFCQMMAKAKGFFDQPESVSQFWDLKDPKWSSCLGAIGACVADGIMTGYSDGSFYPEGTMTRAEVVCAIYKLIGLGEPPKNPKTVTPTHLIQVLSFNIGGNQMQINGKNLQMDTAPVIIESRTLLPVRFVAEPLGAQIQWDQKDQKVTITTTRPMIGIDQTVSTTTATTLELWLGKAEARVNGKTVSIDPSNPAVTPVLMPPGRTMLPLRFIAESLGAQVQWVQDRQEVDVVWSPPEALVIKTVKPP